MYLKTASSFLLALFLSATAFAASVNGLAQDELQQLRLNQADQIYPLVVKKYDPATNTTLSLKVMSYDLGGSSDVSNLTAVYLGGFSFNEMQSGGSLHLIGKVSKVLSVTRLAAGVYQVIAEEWPVGEAWPSPVSDFRLRKVAYRLNAVQLSMDLRALAGVEEFEHKQFTTPISITRTVLD